MKTPTSLSFGAQLVGTTSVAQTVTLTNGQNSTLTITSITATGDFSQTNNCGSSLQKLCASAPLRFIAR